LMKPNAENKIKKKNGKKKTQKNAQHRLLHGEPFQKGLGTEKKKKLRKKKRLQKLVIPRKTQATRQSDIKIKGGEV